MLKVPRRKKWSGGRILITLPEQKQYAVLLETNYKLIGNFSFRVTILFC